MVRNIVSDAAGAATPTALGGLRAPAKLDALYQRKSEQVALGVRINGVAFEHDGLGVLRVKLSGIFTFASCMAVLARAQERRDAERARALLFDIRSAVLAWSAQEAIGWLCEAVDGPRETPFAFLAGERPVSVSGSYEVVLSHRFFSASEAALCWLSAEADFVENRRA